MADRMQPEPGLYQFRLPDWKKSTRVEVILNPDNPNWRMVRFMPDHYAIALEDLPVDAILEPEAAQ